MAHLVVENGPQAGTASRLDRDQTVTIGSGERCTLRLEDTGVARDHAVIKALKGEGFGVKSLATGLRINGREVEAARLEEGDILELGTTRIRYGIANDVPAQRQLGGFRLLEELGRGGMGVVYRAEQISLNRQVALKVLSKELTEDPVFVARFVAEARAAARLHHPNVVQVFDVDHQGDTYFYSMELLHEGSLEERLRRQRMLPVDQAIQAVADAAAGLSYAESLRIVHRDIKPDNLMLDQHGTVKISDLGLALTEEDAGEKVLGTPHFMSPEQALRKPVDHRSDLYALGCTFYRLITGRTPFSGSTVKEILRAQVRQEPEPAHKVNEEVPPEVSAIISKLLAKDPEDRYQSASVLRQELEALLVPPTRKAVVIGSVVMAMVVAGAALVFALTRENSEPQIIELYRDNPEAQRLARENIQLQAEVARLNVQRSGLEGLALADALDAMAGEHPNTEAARRARDEAEATRTEQARLAEARAVRAREVNAAVTRLEEGYREALGQGDFQAALGALTAQSLPAGLGDDPAITAAVARLRQDLRGDAERRLMNLRQAIHEANEGEPEELSAALDNLQAVLDPVDGWPRELLATESELTALVESGRQQVIVLQEERHRRLLESGWERYGAGLHSALSALRRLDLEAAAGHTEGLVAELDQHPGGARAEKLTQAMRAASAFLGRFEAAVADGTVTFPAERSRSAPAANGLDEDLPVLGFQRDGPEAGLTLNLGRRSRPRPELVPLADLRAEDWVALTSGTDAPAVEQRAFLALTALLDHVAEGQAYLGRIRRDRDDSGTGAQGYGLDAAVMEELLPRLGEEAWAGSLGRELRAGIRLVQGMRALSENRPRAGAAHLDRLLEEFPRSIVVQALR